jgi:hypothetical protein
METCPYPSAAMHGFDRPNANLILCSGCHRPLIRCSSRVCLKHNGTWNMAHAAHCRYCGIPLDEKRILANSGMDSVVRLLEQGRYLEVPLPQEQRDRRGRDWQLRAGPPGWFLVVAHDPGPDQSRIDGLQIGRTEFELVGRFLMGRVLGLLPIRADLLLVQTTQVLRIVRMFSAPEQTFQEVAFEQISAVHRESVSSLVRLPSDGANGHIRFFGLVRDGEARLYPMQVSIDCPSGLDPVIDLQFGSALGSSEDFFPPVLTSAGIVVHAMLEKRTVALRFDAARPGAPEIDPLPDDIVIRPGRIHYHPEIDRFFCITAAGQLVKLPARGSGPMEPEPLSELNLTGFSVTAGPGSDLCLIKPGSSLVVYQTGIGRWNDLSKTAQRVRSHGRLGGPAIVGRTIALAVDPDRPRLLAWEHTFHTTSMRMIEESHEKNERGERVVHVLTDDGRSQLDPVAHSGCLAWLGLAPSGNAPPALALRLPAELGDPA